MWRTAPGYVLVALALIGGLVVPSLLLPVAGQHPAREPAPAARAATPAPGPEGGPAPRRISADELHGAGGVPPGWTFTLPPGDAATGRQVFVDHKCYVCHAIEGERFALGPGDVATLGPDLSSVGAHHPAGYIVESILNPNAVIVDRPGAVGADGRSLMPMSPTMTVGQLVDLVAYLSTRRSGEGHGDHPQGQGRPPGPGHGPHRH
ncbi:MAG: c-type cytochrome [Candidatus Rokubacteria bacterium]|nr:c-type cytochrome [Candidatus Rokubacteria bacterium]